MTDGPETELIESHEPGKHGAHADVYVAIRDAFNAAGRKLQDYARRRRVPLSCMRVGRDRAAPELFPKGGITESFFQRWVVGAKLFC